jgi:myo-inositol 2-dehydrogenase/D-chiro-inositol 1-dehydrogenase
VSSTSETTRPVRLALFGIGRAGSIHLANIIGNSRINLRYIVEADRDRWPSIRKRWNLKDDTVTFLHPTDAGTVYADAAVDACLIATPTFTHEGFIVGSLESGKDVFCEKPVAESDEGTAKCYAMAKKVGKHLFCAFNRRFDPSFRHVYDRIRAGM